MDDIIVSGKPLGELKVTELKDELGKRQLSKSGNKSQLAQRLGEYLLSHPEGSVAQVKEQASARKASPEKNVPGDNPFIAQYLAERESLLAESLDHKRKVQAVAERRAEDTEKAPSENAENNAMAPSQVEESGGAAAVVARAPSVHEEEIADVRDVSPNSRRKGRKPELRRSARSEQEDQEISGNNDKVETSPTLVVPTTRMEKSVSPPRHRKSPSPKKDTLGSQPAVVKSNASPAAVEQNEVTVPVVPSSQLSLGEISTNDGFSVSNRSSKNDVEDVIRDVPEESWTMEVNEVEATPEFLRDAKNVRPAAGEESVPENSVSNEIGGTGQLGKGKQDVESPDTVKATGQTSKSTAPSLSMSSSAASAEPTITTSPSRKLTTADSDFVIQKKDETEKTGTTSSLAKTLSIEEEKLDYGEIEGDDDVPVKDEQKSLNRTPSPRGQKRQQSPVPKDKEKSNRSTGEKIASEKSNGSLGDLGRSREAREPPRKMSRYGFNPIRDEVQKIVSADAADNKRALSPPSARNTPTRMIHIKNLTRPYIEKQLKELLNKTGTLIEDSDHFWLDSIKSQCVATFTTEEEAEVTRKALFNLVWPDSNPRQLYAEFVKEDEFKQITSVPSTPTTPTILPDSSNKRTPSSGLRPQIDRGQVEKLKITVASNKETGEAHRDVAIAREEKRLERRAEREKELEARGKDETDNTPSPKKEPLVAEREWDRGKPATEADKEEVPKPRSESEQTKPAGIPLDVLFHRTETRPQIYWKPLTEEQVKLRDEEELKLTAEREERRKQFDQDRPRPGTDENNKFRSDRIRRDASRERPRESLRRRSRSRGRDDRGGRPASYRRTSPGSARRRPSPGPRFSGGGRRRSRSRSPGRRY